MAKSSKQKLKLLYLIKILSEKSDELHPMSMKQILDELLVYHINAERKSIYSDIEELNLYGYDIVLNPSKRSGGYYMATREFELAEVKLLVDAVQASRFISYKKSQALIKKLEQFASRYDAASLQRQVYVKTAIKSENEKTYYSVDTIHEAIHQQQTIAFVYLQWNLNKVLEPKKTGQSYVVDPGGLIWKEENYYFVGCDSSTNQIKHFRVDKMEHVKILKSKISKDSMIHTIDFSQYANKHFGMFAGEEAVVELQCAKHLIGVMIDRFGKEIGLVKKSEDIFNVRLCVEVSSQFFGWLTGLGKSVKIVGPVDVKQKYLDYMKEILEIYEDEVSKCKKLCMK